MANTLTVEEEAIQTILSRAEKGRAEYGEGLHEAEKSLEEWLDYAIEECIDKALYMMRAKRKLREALVKVDEPIPSGVDEFAKSMNEVIQGVADDEADTPVVGGIYRDRLLPEFTVTVKRVQGITTWHTNPNKPSDWQLVQTDTLDFLKRYAPVGEEPEIKVPRQGEVWQSKPGKALRHHEVVITQPTTKVVAYGFVYEIGGSEPIREYATVLSCFLDEYEFSRGSVMEEKPTQPEPEIKMPMVGEIWKSSTGTAKIQYVDSLGYVTYEWKSLIGDERPGIVREHKDKFIQYHELGRS